MEKETSGTALQYFDDNDFKCKCGCGADVRIDLKLRVDELRRRIGFPIFITSGARCEAYNRKVGGAPRSQHLYGKAVDLHSPAWPGLLVYHAVKLNFGGFGFYRNFTHLDLGSPRSWVGE